MIGLSVATPCYTLRRLARATRIVSRNSRNVCRRLGAAPLPCIALVALVGVSERIASAEEPPTIAPSAPASDPVAEDAADANAPESVREIDPALVAADRFRHVALVANPLGLIAGHVSVEAQWMLAEHHALVVNPFLDVVESSVVLFTGDDRQQFGYGGELGYRYFSGRRGPNGLFVGPSVIYGHNHVSAGADAHGTDVGVQDFSYVGAAIDFGAQGILDSGFTIGGGAGAGLTLRFGDKPSWSPRLLFTIGYAF